MSSTTIAMAIRKLSSSHKEFRTMDILEFAEHPDGLNLKLYPMQKVILKLFFKIPLSDNIAENRIDIPNDTNSDIINSFSEREAIDYLYDNKHINLSYSEIYASPDSFTELELFIGRRGTKTKLTTILASYTLYQLLLMGDPHSRFNNKPTTDEIALTLISNYKRGASRQFRELTGAITNSNMFRPYLARMQSTSSEFWLRTPAFISLENQGRVVNVGNIVIRASAANDSVRGDANIVVVLDEYCHFLDADVKNKNKPIDLAIYESTQPSTMEFVDSLTKKLFGYVFIISSPNGRKGDGYRKYSESFNDNKVLMLNMPSFYINRILDSGKLATQKRNNYVSYSQEMLAHFNTKVSKWINLPEKIEASFNENITNELNNYNSKFSYYLGVDYGFQRDGTALCVCHIEKNYKKYRPPDGKEYYADIIAQEGDFFIVDYLKYIVPKEGEVLDIERVISEVAKAVFYFKVRKATFDQWNEATLTRLHKIFRIGHVMKCTNVTQKINSDMAILTKTLFNEGRVILPKDETTLDIEGNWNLSFKEELFDLTETSLRNQMIKVEDSTGHDDRYKALERALYLAFTSRFEKLDYRGINMNIPTKSEQVVTVKHTFGNQFNITPINPRRKGIEYV